MKTKSRKPLPPVPLEGNALSRRAALGFMGIGVATLVGCVDDLSPTLLGVSLESSSANVTAAGTIMLTATVANGAPQSVEFYEGDVLLISKSAPPFTHNLDFAGDAANGSRTYISKIVDVTAKSAWSNPVVVKVNIAAVPPPLQTTLALTASSANVTAAGSVTLTAAVQNGALTKVEFYEGTALLGTVSAAPFTYTLNFTATSPSQSHSYTAKGYTTAGSVSSNAVTVNVNIGNQAPTVSLIASSSSVTAAGSVTLTATATAKTSTISKVEFYEGTALLMTATAAPYTYQANFTSANNGTKSYTAKAIDSSGNSASSAVQNITVNIPVPVPTVALITSSTSVTAAGSVTLTATVTAPSGETITKVEFYEGTALLATKTTTPYTHAPSYTNANNGAHGYTAKAYSSGGGSTTSLAVNVTVNIVAPTTGTLLATYAQLASSGAYVNFNNPKLNNQKSLLYRAATAQTGGVSYNGGFYIAYSRSCAHAGTIITPNPDAKHILLCQDHGATYNMESNCAWTSPAAKALLTLKIEARVDGIYFVG
jgi:Rieske Fe-S protein